MIPVKFIEIASSRVAGLAMTVWFTEAAKRSPVIALTAFFRTDIQPGLK